jgi:hypothetical protein
MMELSDTSTGVRNKSNVETSAATGFLRNERSESRNDLPRRPNSSLIARLGKISTAILVSSFVVCIGCITFLTFLWTARTSSITWRKLIIAGWATRSITISALALRWATATQAILCTSMLSAILLQIGAVPLPSAAAISIMRVDNTGPWSLLTVIKSKWHRKSILPGVGTVLLSLTTLSLQFTSTALLSSVGLASFPMQLSDSKTFYSADSNGRTFSSQLGGTRSWLQAKPIGYPTFAEWIATETPSSRYGEYVPNNTQGIRDTGTVMRAFLPFGDVNTRNRLTEYNGFGTVVDMRVVCVRPQLTNVVFSIGSGFRLIGLAEVLQKPLGYIQTPEANVKIPMSFDCPFAAAAWKNLTRWPLSLCRTDVLNTDYKQGK